MFVCIMTIILPISIVLLVLITLGLLNGQFQEYLGNCEVKPEKIMCVALAPPPIFHPKEQIPDYIKNRIVIIVHENDLVPRFSIANVAKIVATIREIEKFSLTHKNCFKVWVIYKTTFYCLY